MVAEDIEKLLKSMGCKKGGIDAVFLKVLEAVAMISEFAELKRLNKIEAAKRRIFWRTMKEIANREIKKDNEIYYNAALNIVMKGISRKNGKDNVNRTWLPMHFAMSVPNIDLIDIQTLFEYDPESIKQGLKSYYNYTPCHLAVMMNDPNMALIEQLKVFDPGFGGRLTGRLSTPLHLAAQYSSSVTVIQELIRVHPKAMVRWDQEKESPVSLSVLNGSPVAIDILQTLIDAASQIEILPCVFNGSSLHYLLQSKTTHAKELLTEKKVSILLNTFPYAVNIRDIDELLPVEVAAQKCKIQMFRMIVEACPVDLLLESNVAHYAVGSRHLSHVHYIHSVVPELFMSVDDNNRPPLYEAILSYDCTFVQAVVSLAPDATRMLDSGGNNLLHFLGHEVYNYEKLHTVEGIDILRLLLRLIPGGALATNFHGQTPYDLLDSDDLDHWFPRRLLLLAGASSLHPETLKQMNYEARKGALLTFFGDHSGRMDISYRIRHGAGAMELIRQVVSFL